MATLANGIEATKIGRSRLPALKTLALDQRRAALHLATFVAATLTLLVTGYPDIALGGSFVWLMAAWGVVAVSDLGAVAALKALSGTADVHPPVPAGGGIVMTGSISSTVKLDYDLGTAEKIYEPTRFVQLLYRLSFQAPFPYADNIAALQAARHRRTVAGLLTKFWFGENMVAQVLDVRPESDGRYTFVTELVRGTEPKDGQRAKETLRKLTERFLDSGLPTWQVGHYNPKAIPNLLEQDDGSYRIIDLESNLVTPFMPPAALIRAIRIGQYPSFDDVDVKRLFAYLVEHRAEIIDELGREQAHELFRAARSYANEQGEWLGGEARIPSKVLRFAFRLVDVPTWVRAMRRMTSGSQQLADNFIHAGVSDWADEGHIDEDEADRLHVALATPEIASVTANLGAHMALSIPLRFPFGSLARAIWTVVNRAKAEWRALRGQGSATTARQVHTVPVALMGLVPGFGAGAYLLAKPLRAHRALAFIVFDRLLRKVPARLYWRLHLVALMTWFASPIVKASRPGKRSIVPAVRERITAVSGRWPLVFAVVAMNATALAAVSMLHQQDDVSWSLSQSGLLNSVRTLQLAAAGVIGVLAFRAFWRGSANGTSSNEAAGIFLWGITGIGLVVFALDDFFAVREAVGRWIASNLDLIPLFTSHVADFIVLGYGVAAVALLAAFRHELVAARASSVLLAAGVFAAVLVVGSVAYGQGIARAFEFPSQVAAVSLLMLAYATRYLEVRPTALCTVRQTDTVLPSADFAALGVGGGQ